MYSDSRDSAEQAGSAPVTCKVRVWDLPTRIFHWVLLSLVLILFVTGKLGGEAMVWHGRAAFGVAVLLLFRLLWGFWGGHWSRFSSLPLSPNAFQSQFNRTGVSTPWTGHSPSGSLSILGLLLALSAQVISGSFSADLGEFFGPFTDLVSETFVKSMTWYHKNPGQWALIGLTVLHVMAIAYYRWFNRIDLVRPMITGDKQLSEQVTASRDDATKRIVAIAVVVCCSLAVLWVLRWAAASAAPY